VRVQEIFKGSIFIDYLHTILVCRLDIFSCTNALSLLLLCLWLAGVRRVISSTVGASVAPLAAICRAGPVIEVCTDDDARLVSGVVVGCALVESV